MTFEEYREEILSALGVTDDVNIRNFADFREAVLTKLGVEFTEEDLRNEEHFRLKFLEGLQGGGGGSSDFSTANLQVVNQGGYPTNLRFATIRNNIATIGGYPENTDSGTYPVILYKGLAGLTVELLSRGNISISGSIESLGNNFYTITGDCTITIS